MRAVVWRGSGQLVLEEQDVPRVVDGQELVAVSHVGICGTDLSILGGHHPRARPPLVIGHEMSGRRVADGAPVAIEPLLPCGRCPQCRAGDAHVCVNLHLLGIDAPGGMAEFVAVPAARLHRVPDPLPLEEAALVEPLAVAVHAVRISRFRPGDAVVIFGAGPVGLLLAEVLRVSAAAQVIVSEADPGRLELARALGVRGVDARERPLAEIHGLTDGEGADIVFDAAGHPSVAEQLVAACRTRGQVVLVGIYKKPAELDLQGIAFREISLCGSRVYTSGDFRFAVSLAASGRLRSRSLISHVLPLDQAARGFELAAGGGGAMKVLFEVERASR